MKVTWSHPYVPARMGNCENLTTRSLAGQSWAVVSGGAYVCLGLLPRPTLRGFSFPTGRFWHISDLHLDPNYTISKDPLQVCPSAQSRPVPNPGPWGDYLCDSPWVLVNSSIYAMKEIEPKPDFIFWTG